ncbi:hypothetical protein H5410_031516 [Solanum commersonii]|uniref:Uncharacterized protein n=1 Tax=Solanum commersonii TaxID=4109 RepID=A0A9J5YIJ2_SOLCO|nr:hypothetical protein H5410_031516 [Solanum commersonii]
MRNETSLFLATPSWLSHPGKGERTLWYLHGCSSFMLKPYEATALLKLILSSFRKIGKSYLSNNDNSRNNLFSGLKHVVGVEVKFDARVIPKTGCSKYVDDGQNGGLPPEFCVIRRYRQIIKLSFIEWWLERLFYVAVCKPLKNSHDKKMKVVKMRMLRCMCRYTKRYKIRNEDIQDKVY